MPAKSDDDYLGRSRMARVQVSVLTVVIIEYTAEQLKTLNFAVVVSTALIVSPVSSHDRIPRQSVKVFLINPNPQ